MASAVAPGVKGFDGSELYGLRVNFWKNCALDLHILWLLGNGRFGVEVAWRPKYPDILRSLQGTDSVVVGADIVVAGADSVVVRPAAHHIHLDGVSDVGTEMKLNLRCSSARPKCGPIWAESKQK